MHPFLAVGRLVLAAGDGPPVTEVVPVRLHGDDSSWPPVLAFFVFVVVVGGLVAGLVFLRRAREATRPPRRSLDG
jgi:hypothetical protein